MNRYPQRRGAQMLISILVLGTALALAPPAHAAGTSYYVDTLNGSDSAAGTSPASAWKTLAKVNAKTFQPGDSILFHTGQAWSGQLSPKGSGSAAGGPITIASYGGGERPRIDASSLAGSNTCTGAAALLFSNQQYWTIDGLEIVSDSGTDNLTGKVRAGICMTSSSSGLKSGITITDNYIHDVNGCFRCTGFDGHLNGGIAISATMGDYDDVYIADNIIENAGRVGILFADRATGSYSTRVTVRNNIVLNVDGDGIIVSGAEGSLIERNVVGNAGLRSVSGAGNPESAGIWWSYTDHTTVQFNEVYGTGTHGFGGQGYDIDVSADHSKIQYNHSHDNQGGFLLLMGSDLAGSSNAVVRYNLSVNDAFPGTPGEAIISTSSGVTDHIEFHNNTFYVPPGSPAWIMSCTGAGDDCNDSATEEWSFRNNLIVNHGSGNYDYIPPSGPAAFLNNLYYGAHPVPGASVPDGRQALGEPAEPGKLTVDPQLVAPGGSSPADYRLQAGSPAIGAGLPRPQNGGVDYFGRVLPAASAPTLGFHEAVSLAGPPTLVDGADGFLELARATTNVTLDSSSPSSFGGDASRFTKSGSSSGSITWLFEDMQGFQAVVYLRQANPSSVSFWASPDGRSFTQVGTVNTAPQATAGNWSTTTYTPAAPLPAGTAFLKVTLAPPAPFLLTSPKVELGQISISR